MLAMGPAQSILMSLTRRYREQAQLLPRVALLVGQQSTVQICHLNPSRNCPGVIPVQRLNARLKLLVSANPNR